MNASLEVAFEGVVVVLCAWQAGRLAVRPVVRRAMRRAPLAVLGLAAGAIAVLAATVWIASQGDTPRRSVVGVLAVALVAAAWRARPAFGTRRGLPPGSLGLVSSLRALDDRSFYARAARRHGPVFKTSQFGRPVVCIVGLERARRLLMDRARQIEGAPLPYNRLIPKGALRYMNNRDHREISGLFRTAIAATDLASSERPAREAFRSELARLAAESSARPEAGVAVRPAVDRALFAGLVRILYGLAPDRGEVEEIRAWNGLLTFSEAGGRAWRRRMQTGLEAVAGVLRRATGPGGASHALPPSASTLGRMLEAEPAALADATVAANLVLIFRMAHRDTADLLVWVFKMLSDHPGWIERVRREPEATHAGVVRPADTLGGRIVMETLRLEQSEYLYRRVAESFEIDGFRIPVGWLVRVCVQESHRDPTIFEHPDRFDPDRFARRSFARTEYSPFGADSHGCMGPAIVHFLGRLFVEELTRGFDWAVVRDGPLERGTRHWHHWRPSARLRASFTARASGSGAGDVSAA